MIFYRTDIPAAVTNGEHANDDIKVLLPIAQFGGPLDGLTGRIKDFETVRLPSAAAVLFIACGSDGIIRLWVVEDQELTECSVTLPSVNATNPSEVEGSLDVTEPVGQLIGLYESRNRITCVKAFLMSRLPEEEPHDVRNGSQPGRNGDSEVIDDSSER